MIQEHVSIEDWLQLQNRLRTESQYGLICPEISNIFRVFKEVPLNQVKVVILGQDPYHGAGQANGLAFAVNENVEIPPSLSNIFKEVESDIGSVKADRTLSAWANQGVFLLNSFLSVKRDKPLSHEDLGWEAFTDKVIWMLSTKRTPIVFMLWGQKARAKKRLIRARRHLVLEAAHPSPLSAYNGFFGCKHFSQANEFLRKHYPNGISW